MTQSTAPKLAKWPFFAGDVLLLTVACWIVSQSPNPFAFWPLFFVFVAVAAGAWISIIPFLIDHKATLKFAESRGLNETVAQIKNIEGIASQIGLATGQWQSIQEQARQTAQQAHEVVQRIGEEARAFTDFMQKANDAEKSHLRLEVDKMRRGEGEWLQSMVRLLDHVHALYQAGVRSGQANVREQLGSFQAACRDTVRRLGLVPFDAASNEPFNDTRHQVMEGEPNPPAGAPIDDVIATGFTFQGQLLRRAVVSIRTPAGEEETPATREGEVESDPDETQEELIRWDGDRQ